MASFSHWSFTNNDWDKCHYTKKKSSLEQSSSLHNQIHDIINPKYFKKEKNKNLEFPQEWQKD